MGDEITDYTNDLLLPHMTWKRALLEDYDCVWLYDVTLKTPIGPYPEGTFLVAVFVDWKNACVYLTKEWSAATEDDSEEHDRLFTFCIDLTFGGTVDQANRPVRDF